MSEVSERIRARDRLLEEAYRIVVIGMPALWIEPKSDGQMSRKAVRLRDAIADGLEKSRKKDAALRAEMLDMLVKCESHLAASSRVSTWSVLDPLRVLIAKIKEDV